MTEAEQDAIADFMGTLYGAARHDLDSVEAGAVGLNGVNIKQWREAYLEGIKDTANGASSHINGASRERFTERFHAASEAEYTRCRMFLEEEGKRDDGSPDHIQ